MNIKVEIINQLSDNYSYIIYSIATKEALVVDPSESKPIINYIKNNHLILKGLLITHHHTDHTSGIKDLLKFKNVDVYTPNLLIPETTKLIKDKDKIFFDFVNFLVISTPGHTLDHVVYYNDKEKFLFSGDTLFYYGCGRLFEGTMEQMLTSLKKIKDLPDDTSVYCGHEYTYKNLEFVLKELVYWQDRGKLYQRCKELIKKNGSSMPFYLGHQKDWIPFLNCDDSNYKKGIANFHKNEGKISVEASELDFFTFIRNKRNRF